MEQVAEALKQLRLSAEDSEVQWEFDFSTLNRIAQGLPDDEYITPEQVEEVLMRIIYIYGTN